MKRVSVVLMILAIAALPVAAVAEQAVQDQSSKTASHNDNRQNKKTNSPILASAQNQKNVPPQSPATEERSKGIYTNDAKTDWWARISNILIAIGTLALALVGAIAACFALRTLRSIERQTDALIASERARIGGEVTGHKIAGTVRYALTVTNHGKTPARMFGYDFQYGLLSEGAEFSNKSLSTHFSEEAYLLIGGGETKTIRDDFDMDDIFANRNGELRGAFQVTIKYFDMVSDGMEQKVHETSLAYVYNLVLSALTPMHEHNKYT